MAWVFRMCENVSIGWCRQRLICCEELWSALWFQIKSYNKQYTKTATALLWLAVCERRVSVSLWRKSQKLNLFFFISFHFYECRLCNGYSAVRELMHAEHLQTSNTAWESKCKTGVTVSLYHLRSSQAERLNHTLAWGRERVKDTFSTHRHVIFKST